ncbi:hypothetical protein C0992_002140 [Termitomyces sp. T32_za158]|nr:hypothetical protein C0992_002140 [Termitomyces sp. T32_za158]
MKLSAATFLVLLPLVSQAVAVSVHPRLSLRQEDFNFKNRQGHGGRNDAKGGKNNNDRVANAASASAHRGRCWLWRSTDIIEQVYSQPRNRVIYKNLLTALDPRVIAKGFANNGQDVPAAGQVASLTSTNNFINFCLTVPNLPITDGKQITTGSCNPAPIGTIPSVDKMPSAKFTFPANGGTVTANQQFTITMAINNLATGNFVNADENYFAAPQQLDNQGQIIGHSHVVVETLTSTTQTTPTDPRNFAFFKGLNDPAANGVLTAAVTAGLPAGAYRLCSINTCANHQPAIVPIAQHGALDDCIYVSELHYARDRFL